MNQDLIRGFLDDLFVSMNEGIRLQREITNLYEKAGELNPPEVIHRFITYEKTFENLIIKFMGLNCPEKYLKFRDFLLDFYTFTQSSTSFYGFYIKASSIGLVDEVKYFYDKSMEFHDKAGKALDLLEKELKRLIGITKD